VHPHIHGLPDPEFLEALREYNGIPDEANDNEEILDLMLPTVRADLELYETYTYARDKPLACPISAFGGRGDKKVPPEHVVGWCAETEVEFSLRVLSGDHFLPVSARQSFLDAFSHELAELVMQPC
jgi:medium-chain acyl-[acyl-carrier-protein] hydrolase